MNQAPQQLKLIVNGSATSTAQRWPGGKGLFSAVGTFAGATVALQYLLPDGATWYTPASASMTAAGGLVFELPQVNIRAYVTGGPPSGMYVNADWIPE